MELSFQKAWNELSGSEQQIISDEPVPQDQIKDELSALKDEGKVYQSYVSHPMIVHHTKRAHVYKVCCEPIETFDRFTEKLATFDPDSNEKDDVQTVLHEWFVPVFSPLVHFIHNTHCSVRQKAPPNKDPITVDNECSATYKDLEKAMVKRQQ